MERVEHPIIVIPEGLAYDPTVGRALTVPSFVGQAVLKRVLDHYATGHILIPPGNSFGAPLPEHEVMAAWLVTHGCTNVETPSVTATGYIDTWCSAVLLRRWLEQRGQWPLGSVVLVVAFRHATRARLCFSRNSFAVSSIDIVHYPIEGIPIVPRLLYYNWPRLHQAYEMLALVRDRFRPIRAG